MKLTALNNSPSFGIITTRAIHAIRQQAEGFHAYNSVGSTDGYTSFEYDELNETQLKRIETLAKRAAKLDRIIIDCDTLADRFEDGTRRNDSKHIKETYGGLNLIGMLKNKKFITQECFQFKKSQKGDADAAIRMFEEVVKEAEKLNQKRKFYIFKVDYEKPESYRAFKPDNMDISSSYSDERKNSIINRIYKQLTTHVIFTKRKVQDDQF